MCACVGGGFFLFSPPRCHRSAWTQVLAPVLWENSSQTCGDEQGIDINSGVDRTVEQLHFQLLTSDLTINMSLPQTI